MTKIFNVDKRNRWLGGSKSVLGLKTIPWGWVYSKSDPPEPREGYDIFFTPIGWIQTERPAETPAETPTAALPKITLDVVITERSKITDGVSYSIVATGLPEGVELNDSFAVPIEYRDGGIASLAEVRFVKSRAAGTVRLNKSGYFKVTHAGLNSMYLPFEFVLKNGEINVTVVS